MNNSGIVRSVEGQPQVEAEITRRHLLKLAIAGSVGSIHHRHPWPECRIRPEWTERWNQIFS
jgi:hypothetical protein